MADTVSQDQINELLRTMQVQKAAKQESGNSGQREKTKYSKYDFYSPRKFTKDKMKILTSAFENYARVITSQLNGIFRVSTEITVKDVQEGRYYEFVGKLSENDSITLADAYTQEKNKAKVPLMMYVTPGLVITLVTHMLGGGDEAVHVEEDYRYSDVELALYGRIVDYMIQALKDGFANYVNIEFQVQRIAQNPSLLQDIGLDEAVALITLNADMAGLGTETIQICLPGTLLEMIFRLMDSHRNIGRGFAFEDNQETIMEHLRMSQLQITGQLATVELVLKDIYHLRPGDVIDLNKPRNGDVKLFIGKRPWFTGKMGTYKKNVAVRISDRINKDDREMTEENGQMDIEKPKVL